MLSKWMLWSAATMATGDPLLGLAVLAVASWLGEGWWHGRLWRPWVWLEQWLRIRKLRAHLLLSPHDATARADLGRLLVERGRYAEAVPHLEAVVAKLPNLAFPAWHLGRAYLAEGRLEAGREAVEKALAIRRDLEFGKPLVAVGDALAGQGRWPEALAFYERAESANASSVEILYKLGRARQVTGDAAGAVHAWAEAQALYRSSPGFKRRGERTWALRTWVASLRTAA